MADIGEGAMHPALAIPEIIFKICDNYTLPADRPTLLALSCTCKAFSDVATDALWKYIRGTTTFSKMLFPDPPRTAEGPGDAWRSRSERFQAFVAERERLIAAGLDEKRRDRVVACARRVRKIEMGPNHMNNPETYTFFAFIAANPPPHDPTRESQAILANLRELECTLPSVHGITHAIHLIQFTSDAWAHNRGTLDADPTTADPTVDTKDDPPTSPSSLRSLTIAANVPWTYQTPAQELVDERFLELARSFKTLRGLERLDFRCDQLSASIELALAKSLKWLVSLKYAKLGFKKHAVGWVVASTVGHPSLKEIQMNFSRDDVPGGLEPHPSGPFVELLEDLQPVSFTDGRSYPSLETLHISAVMETMLDTLDYFGLPSTLRHLQLHVGVPIPEKLAELTRYIAGYNTPSIHTLVISDSRLWLFRPNFGTATPFTTRCLHPLLTLPLLETLVVDVDVVFHVTDDDLGMMASAWPRLRKLQISPLREVEEPNALSLPSFWGIKALTDRCHELDELKLKVDASRNAPSFLDSLSIGLPGHQGSDIDRKEPSRLSVWSIGASVIREGDGKLVADIVRMLFPQLRWLGLPFEADRMPAKWADWIIVREAVTDAPSRRV